jgi:hypothetical protein
MLAGKRAFFVLSALAFAACFLVSEYGRAKQLHWLMGWPPLLFVFTVPPEYRWRFTSHSWAREVFTVMTSITCTGLALGAVIETLVIRSGFVAPATNPPLPLRSELAALIPVVALGGLLFGGLSLFSAWGLYSVFYRPDGVAVRGRERGKENEDKGSRAG